MVADFEKYKFLIEVKSSILKATGLYLKDMIGSVAHLANAVLLNENPSDEDLDNYAGLLFNTFIFSKIFIKSNFTTMIIEVHINTVLEL